MLESALQFEGDNMKSIWLPATVLFIGIAALVWFGGVRVVVVPDMPELGKAGATLVVARANKLHLVERPAQYCADQGKVGDDMCVAGTLAAMLQGAKILAKF